MFTAVVAVNICHFRVRVCPMVVVTSSDTNSNAMPMAGLRWQRQYGLRETNLEKTARAESGNIYVRKMMTK